jgi:hypothetical protein
MALSPYRRSPARSVRALLSRLAACVAVLLALYALLTTRHDRVSSFARELLAVNASRLAPAALVVPMPVSRP